MFNSTSLPLSSDVDQDTYGKVTQTQESTKKCTTYNRAERSALSQQVTTRLQETEKTAQIDNH